MARFDHLTTTLYCGTPVCHRHTFQITMNTQDLSHSLPDKPNKELQLHLPIEVIIKIVELASSTCPEKWRERLNLRACSLIARKWSCAALSLMFRYLNIKGDMIASKLSTLWSHPGGPGYTVKFLGIKQGSVAMLIDLLSKCCSMVGLTIEGPCFLALDALAAEPSFQS